MKRKSTIEVLENVFNETQKNLDPKVNELIKSYALDTELQEYNERRDFSFEEILSKIFKQCDTSNCSSCDNKDKCYNEIGDLLDSYNSEFQGRIPYSKLFLVTQNLEDSKYDSFYHRLHEIVNYFELKREKSLSLAVKILDNFELSDAQFNHINDLTNAVRGQLLKELKEVSNQTKHIKRKQSIINKTFKVFENKVKSVENNLFSIVSIFVAISFVMFGGMSLLNNLFDYSNMTSIPLLEMVCGGSLIGLIIVNAVYIFIIFLLKITGRAKSGTDLVYESYVKWFSKFLIAVVVVTLLGWFFNIRNVNDVYYVNSNCKTIEYNEETKEVTLVCPASDEESNK